MKKELLRMQDIYVKSLSDREIYHVFIYLLEGESVGLLGLANSGKDLLVKILTGEEQYSKGTISICGKKIQDKKALRDIVYTMTDQNYLISNWTIWEYLGLVNHPTFLGIASKKRLIIESQKLMQELELSIDVTKQLREITEFEKRLVDVAKAYRQKAVVLLIEDEFEGFSREEIKQFKRELSRLLQGRMTAVISNHSDMIVNLLSDRFVLFKNGKVVKKCRNEGLTDISHLEKYLLGESMRSKKQSLDNLDIRKKEEVQITYEVMASGVYENKSYIFSFQRGEITTILTLNRKEKEIIFNILAGHINGSDINRRLENRACEFLDIADFVRGKIVSVQHLGNIEELLPCMSAGENILIPSLNKLSPIEYTLAGNKIVKMLEKGSGAINDYHTQEVKELGVNDRITLTLERWLVYNPKVLLLFEPFAQCDTYGVAVVKSYMKKIAAGGTAVVVVKSREEYVEEISDHFIHM